MRSIIFFTVILTFIGVTLCQSPPKLPQQFTTNFTLVLPGYVSPTDSPVLISGFFALDYINAGLFLEVGAEEYVPLSFHTNIVVSPNLNQGIGIGYMYEGPLCWNFGPIPSSLFIWLPFQLPPNTPFIGNKVVAGQACTGWKLNINIEGASAMTVWVSKNTTTIVQIDVDNLKYLGDVQINFFNTVVGPFSPSIYAPPNKVNPKLSCTNVDNFLSTLLLRK